MLRAILRNSGIAPGRIAAALAGWRRYLRDRRQFQMHSAAATLPWGNELPMLTEWNESSGSIGAYFLQDQTVARWIHVACPVRHIDVGSRLDGFIGSLSVFREVEVIDIRPQPMAVANVKFQQLDLMEPLPDVWVSCTDSISCLHTIEHFGLGRYGDPIDPAGHLRGLEQLKRMVKPGGIFYLSTPIGPERVEFNAHRVFAPQTLIRWFSQGWNIERCAVIDDSNGLAEGTDTGSLRDFRGTLGVGIIAARKTNR